MNFPSPVAARWFAGVAVLGMFAVTGCSGSPAASTTASVANTSSPLTPYQAGALTTVDPAKSNAVQEKIAACMKTAGFQYIPVPVAAADPAAPIYGDRAWTEKHGYGISESDLATSVESKQDPNTALTKKMTDSERTAYNAALYGNSGVVTLPNGDSAVSVGQGGGGGAQGPGGQSPVKATGNAAPKSSGAGAAAASAAVPAPAAPQGCNSTANAAVFGTKPQVNTADFKDLFAQMDKLAASVDLDPRVTPKVAAWAGCMAQAGYPGLTKIADARDSAEKSWAELNGFTYTPSADGSGASIGITNSTGPDAKPPVDPAKIAAFKKVEIATALEDLDCRADYQGVHDQVRIELETQFVADHKAELERYRNASNGDK